MLSGPILLPMRDDWLSSSCLGPKLRESSASARGLCLGEYLLRFGTGRPRLSRAFPFYDATSASSICRRPSVSGGMVTG